MIGDYLYELTPRDQVSVRLEPHFERIMTTATAASLTVEHEVERGYCYQLQSILLKAVPFAGATVVQQLSCYIIPPGDANPLQLVLFEATGGPTTIVSGLAASLSGSSNSPITIDRQFNGLIIPEGWKIRGFTTFSIAAGDQTLGMYLYALRFPRGNIAV